MMIMVGIACLVAGITLVGAALAVWCLSAARRKPPTPAELWAIHHNPMWG